jgi:hypothetical protein
METVTTGSVKIDSQMSQILVSSVVGGKALMQSPPFVDVAFFAQLSAEADGSMQPILALASKPSPAPGAAGELLFLDIAQRPATT